MRYLLMLNVPYGTGEYESANWTPDDVKANYASHNRLNKELTDSGELVGLEFLTPPGKAKLVRAADNGMPVTDGVFPEAKEFLAGFWVIDVDTPERAYEIAARGSAAPGPGGKPMNMPIEVRPVMSMTASKE